MTDLRTLCERVIATREHWRRESQDHVGHDEVVIADCGRQYREASAALHAALAVGCDPLDADDTARAILAALDESATERELRAYRRENEALSAAEILGHEVDRLKADVKRLDDVIGEMSE